MIKPALFKKMQKDIIEFRTTFGLPIDVTLNDLDKVLHDSLIIEEMGELSDAVDDVGRIDAIVDSAYVLMGQYVHDYSSPQHILYMVDMLIQVAAAKKFNFEACWDEIHASNMSKTCDNLEDVYANIDYYNDKGITVEHFRVGKLYVLRCLEDAKGVIKYGKTLKSMFYQPAQLEDKVYL